MERIDLGLEDAVLVAIARGVEDPKSIAEILHVDPSDVERALKRLELEGYVKPVEKGFWIFRKRSYVLTERGFERVAHVLDKLKELANFVKERVAVERESLVPMFSGFEYLLWLMFWLNLLDMAMLPIFAPVLGYEYVPETVPSDIDTDSGAETEGSEVEDVGGEEAEAGDVDVGDTDVGDVDVGDLDIGDVDIA